MHFFGLLFLRLSRCSVTFIFIIDLSHYLIISVNLNSNCKTISFSSFYSTLLKDGPDNPCNITCNLVYSWTIFSATLIEVSRLKPFSTSNNWSVLWLSQFGLSVSCLTTGLSHSGMARGKETWFPWDLRQTYWRVDAQCLWITVALALAPLTLVTGWPNDCTSVQCSYTFT